MKEFLRKWIEAQLVTFKGCEHLFLKTIEKANYGKFASKDFTIKTRITLQNKDHDLIRFIVPCFYTLTEIKNALKNGYELYWDFKGRNSVSNSEITLKKIKTK